MMFNFRRFAVELLGLIIRSGILGVIPAATEAATVLQEKRLSIAANVAYTCTPRSKLLQVPLSDSYVADIECSMCKRRFSFVLTFSGAEDQSSPNIRSAKQTTRDGRFACAQQTDTAKRLHRSRLCIRKAVGLCHKDLNMFFSILSYSRNNSMSNNCTLGEQPRKIIHRLFSEMLY